jgi:hypothetical protein
MVVFCGVNDNSREIRLQGKNGSYDLYVVALCKHVLKFLFPCIWHRHIQLRTESTHNDYHKTLCNVSTSDITCSRSREREPPRSKNIDNTRHPKPNP